MLKRVFIIHGWDASSQGDWIPWLKRQLEIRNFSVHTPDMPDSDYPDINRWVSLLTKLVDHPDEETILIGHSIGCQAILRYLETLDPKSRVGPVIFVAPWLTLKPEAAPEEEDKKIIKPWLTQPIDFSKIKPKATSFTAIFSDNDPYVSLPENSQAFKNYLDAKIIIETNKGHFNQDGGVTELPVILEILSELNNKS